jgi:hypothetical protein
MKFGRPPGPGDHPQVAGLPPQPKRRWLWARSNAAAEVVYCPFSSRTFSLKAGNTAFQSATTP